MQRVFAHVISAVKPMTDTERTPAKGSLAHRLITAAFGAVFTISAIALFLLSERTIVPLLAAAGLGLLGADAIVSAYRGTRSLLSRIGPLP